MEAAEPKIDALAQELLGSSADKMPQGYKRDLLDRRKTK